MGTVFSCLATGFMYLGEIMSTAFLAVGEFCSVLSRGLFGLIVGICDVLAACMCCCRVPFEDRPDRDGYTYTTLAVVQPSPLLNLTTRQEVLMGSKDEKTAAKLAFKPKSKDAPKPARAEKTKIQKAAETTPPAAWKGALFKQKSAPVEEKKAA